jgi:shikimate dehydrogenase
MTVPYAEVIGDPIAHSKSPAIHKFWLEKLRLEGDYRSHRLRAGELRDYFEARRADPDWRGCNVTMPLKSAALWIPDFVEKQAHLARAANCLGWDHGRLFGFNTDISGFAACLLPLLAPLDELEKPSNLHLTANVVGAGGAARAVAVALEKHFPRVAPSFYNRTRAKAQAMSSEHRGHPDNGYGLDRLSGYPERQGPLLIITILINASPLGMTGFPRLPVDLAAFGEHTIVFDLVYDPVETPLLKAARDLGLRTVSGLDMLVEQASQAFEIFFGQPAPREHDQELRELLAR